MRRSKAGLYLVVLMFITISSMAFASEYDSYSIEVFSPVLDVGEALPVDFGATIIRVSQVEKGEDEHNLSSIRNLHANEYSVKLKRNKADMRNSNFERLTRIS